MEGLPDKVAELDGDLGVDLLKEVDIVLDDIDGEIPDREVEVRRRKGRAGCAQKGWRRNGRACCGADESAPAQPVTEML